MARRLPLLRHREAWQEAGRRLSQRLFQPLSLGVRGIVLNAQDQILLVRHTYIDGWYFPGGGVEAGETLLEALTRELREEAHIEYSAPPVLHGLFLNRKGRRSNHVACFVVRSFRQTQVPTPNWEIAEARFFALDALPSHISRATRLRLDEVIRGLPPAPHW